MSMPKLEMRRTGWDIALGALLVVAGLAILGNARLLVLPAVLVLYLGWRLVQGVVWLWDAIF